MKSAAIISSLIFSLTCYAGSVKNEPINRYKLSKPQDISNIFPKTTAEIEAQLQLTRAQFKEAIEQIAQIKMEDRNLENTLYAFDKARGLLNTQRDIFEGIYSVHTNEKIRSSANLAFAQTDQIFTDVMSSHPEIYDAILFLENNSDLVPENKKHFVTHLKQELKHQGLGLPEKRREKVRSIKQELSNLSAAFNRNIQEDDSHIWVTRQELYGLSQDFINSLSTKNNHYRLGCDYPTYFNVMKLCKNSQVRKKMYQTFQNRAYPANEAVLEAMIFKRDALAKELGYLSFADMDLSKEMIKSEDKANQFVDDMLVRVMPIAKKEFSLLTEELPSGIYLNDEGKLNAYDYPYVTHLYKKEHYNLDDLAVAEYFPLDNTISGLIKIYEAFFNITIAQEKVSGLWHEDVRTLVVKDNKSNKILGYILLDLHPREGKYGHAANCPMIPAYKQENGETLTALTLVMTNFSKPTDGKPALMQHREVVTFFHEFGHAIHNVMGSTDLMSACGTSTQIDFVELPSQLLEEWMYEAEILKVISSHYQTHESMPNEMISAVAASRSFCEGLHYVRQCYLAKLALAFFKDGANKNTNIIEHKLRDKIMFDSVDPDDLHFHTSFGHLDQYGPKYYGYMWSKVFALDIFEEIKKEGLLNPKAGERYVLEILSKGGSDDPNAMLERYLKRKPNLDSFIRKLGGVN
ncbi:MAG: Zn-dependent oligopeptidase [Rhabdochlamydiaceae bacterium]|nr:Zn-dependent oligopeptidase [Candidatus Amphrikana amoebophyrae]